MLVLDTAAIADQVAFTADNSKLVVGSRNGRVDVWDLPGGAHRFTYIPGDAAAAVRHHPLAVHPAGRVAFHAAGRPMAAIALDTGDVSFPVPEAGPLAYVLASPCGGWVVARGGADRPPLVGFLCSSGGELRPTWDVPALSSFETLVGFVGDGGAFVCVDQFRKRLVVRETPTGAVREELPYPSHHQGEAAASPDGRRLAVMGYDKLYIWDTQPWGKPARVPIGGGRRFASLAFHPTRPVLAGIQTGQTLVKYLDTQTWQVSAKFNWKLGEALAVGFSPDGTLAAAGFVGKIVVWDVDG